MDVEVDTQHLTAARYKIEDLLRLVQQGKVRIPRFQRPLRWSSSDVERLFDSIYRGFPIGTLLFWVREADEETVRLGPVVIDAPKTSEAHWVVDGQQRITSLAASLLPANNRENDPRFEISFDLEREQFASSRHSDVDSRIPVRAAYDLQHVLAWLRDRELAPHLQDRAFKLADRLRNYEIPAYQVTTADEEALQIIFDRTNTFGKSMTKAEVFRALNTSSAEPRADIATLDTEIAANGFGSLPGNTLLYSVLAARGPDVLRDFRSEFSSPDDQIAALETTREAVGRAAVFLRERADVPHFSLVPYQHQTVGLVRFFALHPDPEPYVLVLLRRWFWQAVEVGPIPRLGNTGTLRATTSAISATDPFESVQALLGLCDQPASTFDVGNYRWTTAATRTSVCLLAHLGPIDVVTREEVDATRSIDLLGREALGPIVDIRGTDDLRRSVANRMFVSPADGLSESELSDLLAVADEKTHISHGITEEAASMLRLGDEERFLAMRAAHIESAMAAFVSSRAEREQLVRPPLSHFVPGDV